MSARTVAAAVALAVVTLGIAAPYVVGGMASKVNMLPPFSLGSNTLFGMAVVGIGDLDGDGIPDMAVGAPGDSRGAGAVYILLLNQNGTIKTYQKIADSEGGFPHTLKLQDNFGWSLGSVDLDGDDVRELVVGAMLDDTGGTNRGALYVLHLNSDGSIGSSVKWDSSQGLPFTLDDNDYFGASIASPGDIDANGTPDLVVGFRDDDEGPDRGAVYVLLLSDTPTLQIVGHQKITSFQGGFTASLHDGDMFGGSVAAVGDVNADGVPDIAVGAYNDDEGGPDRGSVYLLFLSRDGTVLDHWKVSSLTPGLEEILNDEDSFGCSVQGLDNADESGMVRIAVGARFDGENDRGAVHILSVGPDRTLRCHERLAWPSQGRDLKNNGAFGSSITMLGDLDKDGSSEFVVGAYGRDTGRGAAFVFSWPNSAPVVSMPLPDQIAEICQPFSYQLPNGAFTDPDGDPLTYVASRADGQSLPEWLTFEPKSVSFSGTPDPCRQSSTSLEIAIIALDDSCEGSIAQFAITITARGDVNLNGHIDLYDVHECLRLASHDPVGQSPAHRMADIDGDSLVTANDAMMLLEYLLALRETLP